ILLALLAGAVADARAEGDDSRGCPVANALHLRTQLRRAVPSADVQVHLTEKDTAILAGSVVRAEDIGTLLSVVQAHGYQAATPVRVSGPPQVQLDVVILSVLHPDPGTATSVLTDDRPWCLGAIVGQAFVNPILTGVGGVLHATFLGAQQPVGGSDT